MHARQPITVPHHFAPVPKSTDPHPPQMQAIASLKIEARDINTQPDELTVAAEGLGAPVHHHPLHQKKAFGKEKMEEDHRSTLEAMGRQGQKRRGSVERRLSGRMEAGTVPGSDTSGTPSGVPTTATTSQPDDDGMTNSPSAVERAVLIEEQLKDQGQDFSSMSRNHQRYIRVPNVDSFPTQLAKEQLMSGVYHHFLSMWKERPPGLLLSIAGSVKGNMELAPEFRDAFQADIHALVTATEAWVIDDGTASGISAVMGKVKKNFDNRGCFIGILPAGRVVGNEALVESEVVYHTNTGVLSGGATKAANFGAGSEANVTKLRLDRNHSHYILVDELEELEDPDSPIPNSIINNKQNKLDRNGHLILPEWGSETATRVLFEKTIRTLGEHSAVYIPSITLVCGGGLSSLIRIYTCLKRNEPVIILKESGRVADAVVEYLKVSGALMCESKVERGEPEELERSTIFLRLLTFLAPPNHHSLFQFGGHVIADDDDDNGNGISDYIEELFCEALFKKPVRALNDEEKEQLNSLLELAKHISEMAISKRLLTVYDIGLGVDLLGVCQVAIDGTDIDQNMKLITAGKWRLTELAKGVLDDRPFDQVVQRERFAKVRTQARRSADRRPPCSLA